MRDREATEGSWLFPEGWTGLFPFPRAWCCVIWRLLSFLLEAEGPAIPTRSVANTDAHTDLGYLRESLL